MRVSVVPNVSLSIFVIYSNDGLEILTLNVAKPFGFVFSLMPFPLPYITTGIFIVFSDDCHQMNGGQSFSVLKQILDSMV